MVEPVRWPENLRISANRVKNLKPLRRDAHHRLAVIRQILISLICQKRPHVMMVADNKLELDGNIHALRL